MKNKKVVVDAKQCANIARILQKLNFRSSFLKREYLTFESDKETKLRAYFYSVAICHQTRTLASKKLGIVGWDYLERVYVDLAKGRSKLLDPEFLSNQTTDQLTLELAKFFSDNGNPQNCTLDRLPERANLIIDASQKLVKNHKGSVSDLISASSGNIEGNKGMYDLLDEFEAYSDPLRKKSGVFIKFMSDAKLIEINDPENFIPIMDYHMQRVLLRLGCIVVNDQQLLSALRNKEPLKSDAHTRSSSIEALRIIANESGHTLMSMNDFFYPLGRSCCKEKTLCKDGVCNKDPCTFNLVVDLPSHNDCIFNGTCKGSKDENYRNLWEPMVDTNYY